VKNSRPMRLEFRFVSERAEYCLASNETFSSKCKLHTGALLFGAWTCCAPCVYRLLARGQMNWERTGPSSSETRQSVRISRPRMRYRQLKMRALPDAVFELKASQG
jgi:hypothetical protein